jgi:Arc/MetJ-type ribon-helix-helix transcriptional regulator
MAIQLTPEQQQRIQAVVRAGAYPSVAEALDAAVTAVESFAAPGFDGRQEELDELLAEGLNSGDAVEADDAFWDRLGAKTDSILHEHTSRKRRA